MKRTVLSYLVIAALAVSAVFMSCGAGIGGSSYKIKMTTEQSEYGFDLFGSGVATVDWGDGSEKVSLTLNEQGVPFKHSYPNASIRTISINGDNITGLDTGFGTSLDVSHCAELTMLRCGGQFTSLDVSNNTALTSLLVSRIQLTSLDVSKNTALTTLYVGGVQFTSLDVSKNTALTTLQMYEVPFTTLDVSKNTALTQLSINSSPLANLDVSKNIALTNLNCNNNQLTSLDVSKNTALTDLSCNNNQLTSLDVSKNTALKQLSFGENKLTNLDVSKNTALEYLSFPYNQFDATALNTVFSALVNRQRGQLRIIGNPEARDCDATIATNKGWRFLSN